VIKGAGGPGITSRASSLLALTLLTAIAAEAAPLPDVLSRPRIHILKSRRELRLYSGDQLQRTYRIGLGLNPVPAKAAAGDNATPEGSFTVCIKNPKSAFLLSLGLSYPGPLDADRGLAAGLITAAQHRQILQAARRKRVPPWNTRLGGEIFIHGRGSSTDWTWGCIALDDSDIQELYPRIPVGTPVRIDP
jgi:murein L,D-transpeptidase YafK